MGIFEDLKEVQQIWSKGNIDYEEPSGLWCEMKLKTKAGSGIPTASSSVLRRMDLTLKQQESFNHCR